MRQLFPHCVDEVDPTALYDDRSRAARPARPYVVVNMVASIDGATAVEGVTAKLGGPGDQRIFLLLRSLADVILVGAQTVRAEDYGPPRLEAEMIDARRARGQSAIPPIAVVSASLNFDWSSRLFTDTTSQPILLTTRRAEVDHLKRAHDRAQVVLLGEETVDLAQGLAALAARGARLLLCEGGPTLNAGLVSEGLVDELCLTVARRRSSGAVGRGSSDSTRLTTSSAPCSCMCSRRTDLSSSVTGSTQLAVSERVSGPTRVTFRGGR